MHDYKNLATSSNIADAAIEGSKRASDLHMKAELLRATHGHRVITVATATPIANSVTEAHVMQRFRHP
jgi:N12 class adenine-specific DNA methylase